MSVNIGQLKKQLQTLGISTNTPGLLGDDRYEELRSRLDEANAAVNQHGMSAPVSTNTLIDTSSSFMMPSMNHLSIGEIRSRLTALGESTTTPNMTGDERRNELLKRLINSICGADKDEEKQAESFLDEVLLHWSLYTAWLVIYLYFATAHHQSASNYHRSPCH